MRASSWMLSMVIALGCAQSHAPSHDGGTAGLDTAVGVDASPSDASIAEGGSTVTPSPPISCGPNRCSVGEICCSATCGVCALPSACIEETVCIGESPDPIPLVCGGTVCALDVILCCPTCETDLCATPGVPCTPVDC